MDKVEMDGENDSVDLKNPDLSTAEPDEEDRKSDDMISTTLDSSQQPCDNAEKHEDKDDSNECIDVEMSEHGERDAGTLDPAQQASANSDDVDDDEEEDEEEKKDETENEEDDDSGEGSSTDDSSDEDETAGESRRRVFEDGRELSEYEILRLERIKRNQEYLANLGLEGKNGGGVLGEKKKAPRPKKKPPPAVPSEPARERSQRTKKSVSYTEPAISIAGMLRQNSQLEQDGAKPKQPPPTPNKKRKERKASERMEKFVYREFIGINRHKNDVLKQAEKDVRAAEKEIKYWARKAGKVELRLKRKEQKEEDSMVESAKSALELMMELEQLGCTKKELLREVDRRTLELLSAAGRYDHEIEEHVRSHEREVKRLEAENKMKTIDALDWFPKALKGNASLLNTVLLERAPKEPPPPRRSKRSVKDDSDSPEPKKKIPKSSSGGEPTESCDWGGEVPQQLESPQPEVAVSSSPEPAEKAGTKRKRSIRIVGGWVSPDFSKLINRSWLERESPLRKFDLESYAPQVGECVLYYPTGHKQFLSHFPDELGKKTRSLLRIPLWERSETRDTDTKNSQSWYTAEWLASLENDTANYPILCRVERTHAEFPPDPLAKVVKKTDLGASVKVVLKSAKDPALLQKIRGTPLRLAVELRPLTPIMPLREISESTDQKMPLPPTFSVVTFPSHVEPFIIPFSLAYSVNHSISLGENVTLRSDGARARAGEFAPLVGETLTCRFEEKVDEIVNFVSSFERAFSKGQFLEEALANAPKGFPLRDGQVVVDALRRFLESRGSLKPAAPVECTAQSFDLFGLLSRTLPLWHGVSVMRNVYNRKLCWLSPWDLVPARGNRNDADVSPDGLAMSSKALDESLRTKIECVIDDFAEDTPEGDDFYYDIDDDVAPSYSCAVPVAMSIEKILRRLKAPSKQNSCYYRGVESILSDVGLILENCLLYNSAESTVVDTASQVVANLKEALLRVSRCHFQELHEVKKSDEERRRLVFRTCSFSGQPNDEADVNGENRPPAALAPVSNTIKNPFKEKVDQDWMQTIKPSFSESGDEQWIPQAGDKVLYSRDNHAIFVKNHYRSLEPFQCVVAPSVALGGGPAEHMPEKAVNADDSGWVSGQVVWTRAAFPKAPSKKSGEDALTFRTNSTLMVLSVRFGAQNEDGNGTILHWRPCLLPCDQSAETACPTCGLARCTSFLRHASISGEDTGVPSLSPSRLSSLDRCITLLKRKCIRGESPVCLDPSLNKANVKNGFAVPAARIGSKALPSFEDLLTRNDNTLQQAKSGTRGISVPRETDPTLPSLVESGFLPQWASTSNTLSAEKLMVHETVSPWAKLSLELVLLRLKNGYYRHTTAIENDVLEAYVSTVVLLLSEAAGRRKSPVSFRRIARLLSASRAKTESVEAALADSEDPVAKEELEWVTRIRIIRDLHSVVLMSAAEPSRIERLMGLLSLQPPKQAPIAIPEEDPERAEARQTIKFLFSALGRDQNLNTFSSSAAGEVSVPPIKIKVVCEGDLVSNVSYSKRITFTTAERDGKLIKVRTVCDGKVISKQIPICEADLPLKCGIVTESDTVDTNQSVGVGVMSNGAVISSGNDSAAASLSHNLGDKSIIRVFKDSLALKKADYEESDTLTRFLFGRPGKMNPCARCQAYRRSLFSCRVKRGHSNLDFDWISMFKDRSLDGILRALHPQELAEAVSFTSPVDLNSADGHQRTENGTMVGATEKGQARDSIDQQQSTQQTAPADNEGPKEDAAQEEKNSIDVIALESSLALYLEQGEKAKAALSLANSLLKEAQDYAKAPARFSKEFIDSAFPIDPTDGHYIYCIICGLSGNLLCCDGCPNVVHSHCVALEEVPEGDWFCEECVTTRSASSAVGDKAVTESVLPETNPIVPSVAPIGDKAVDVSAPAETIPVNSDSAGPMAICELASATKPVNSDSAGPNVAPGDNSKLDESAPEIPVNSESETIPVNSDSVSPTVAPGDISERGELAPETNPVISDSICPAVASISDEAAGESVLETNADNSVSAGPSGAPGDMAMCELAPETKPVNSDSTGQCVAAGDIPKRLPFGRLEFDVADRALRLASLLEELFNSRPDKRPNSVRTNDDGGTDAGDSASNVKKGRGRPRKYPIPDDIEHGSERDEDDESISSQIESSAAERKRGRGRQRKDPPPVNSAGRGAKRAQTVPDSDDDEASSGDDSQDGIVEGRQRPRNHQTKSNRRGQKEEASNKRAERRRNRGSSERRISGLIADEGSSEPPRKRRRTGGERSVSHRDAATAVLSVEYGHNEFNTDPYEILSNVMKRFLGSMGIVTAESFLTTRSTDISEALIQWRRQEGMPELKGTGAVATVSAWKTSVRKAAKEMGKADIAALEPESHHRENTPAGHDQQQDVEDVERTPSRKRSQAPAEEQEAEKEMERTPGKRRSRPPARYHPPKPVDM